MMDLVSPVTWLLNLGLKYDSIVMEGAGQVGGQAVCMFMRACGQSLL
jgi:hypothetical protein